MTVLQVQKGSSSYGNNRTSKHNETNLNTVILFLSSLIFKHAGEFGRQWSQRSAQAATATVNHWWEKYEEFVGLNEVREAQTKVTEVSKNTASKFSLCQHDLVDNE